MDGIRYFDIKGKDITDEIEEEIASVNKEYNAKYLRLTIHDNDFTSSLYNVALVLQRIFIFEGKYPTEADFNTIQKMMQHIWYGVDNIEHFLRWKDTHVNYTENCINIFNCNLSFVDYLDIPDWDNNESVYIPMFDASEEILIR